MHDKIELAVVEAKRMARVFFGYGNNLSADDIVAFYEALRRDITGAALTIAAEYPKPRRKTVRRRFGE